MRRALIFTAVALGACAKIAINTNDLSCSSDGRCLPGYQCDQDSGLCVRAGGDGSDGSGDTGAGGDPATCDLGLLDSCGTCDDDCNVSVENAPPVCEAVANGYACGYSACELGYVDADDDRTNGCEYLCTPAGPETCNGVDDDCSGTADDVADINLDCNTILSTPPQVADFACDSAACDVNHCCVIASCEANYVDVDNDPDNGCEELCAPANPGVEVCDGEDNDCDGQTDNATDGAAGCTPYFRDQDGDTYGVDGDSRCMCAPSGPYTALVGGDCADGNVDVHPGVTEVCNNTDDDCAAGIDDGLGATCTCTDGVNPPRAESCNNIDDNCDGTIDDGQGPTCWCTDGINGPTTEVCNDIDDNCDGTVDDGLGAACRCTDGGLDPLAAEDCGNGSGNGVDDNCNDAVDEGCVTYVQPSNLAGGVDTCQSGVTLTVGAGETAIIDTTWPGSITGVVLPTAPPTVDIDQGSTLPHITAFFFDSIDLRDTGNIGVQGNAAVALIACSDVTLAGRLVVASNARAGAPGGYNGGTEGNPGGGCGGGEAGDNVYYFPDGGGAGGGFGSAGGNGGVVSGTTLAAGGAACGSEALVPLFGGSGGGGGESGGTGTGGAGGGGGGAVQISCNGALTVASTGVIQVGGAGGRGGAATLPNFGSGGGGGAGGGILLEAPVVSIDGILAANGGGGGAGVCYDGGSNGDRGLANAVPAAGGTSSNSTGGAGAATTTAATAGGNCTGDYNASGGGGGVGRIRVNTDGAGGLTYGGNETVSPPATTGAVTFQ